MTSQESLTEYVEDVKRDIGEEVQEDSLDSATAKDAAQAALAMLALGRTGEARVWISKAASVQKEYVTSLKEGKLELVEDQDKQFDINDLRWRQFHNLAVLGCLTGNRQQQIEIGETLYQHATDTALDKLKNREKRCKPYYIAAFGALYLQRDDVHDYCKEARSRLPEEPSVSLHQVMIDAIDAIATGDKQEVSEKIESVLSDYHSVHVVDNREGFHFTLQTVSREATALITLARRQGIDVHIDSEYIPEAVYDEEHYPLSGT